VEQRLSLVTLGVSDLIHSTAFYERLGWRRSVKAAQGVAFFQLGGMALALWPRKDLAADAGVPLADHGPGTSVSLAQNVARREDVDRLLAEAVAAGATLVRGGQATEWGGYTGYFADPDNFLWEIAFNPGFALLEDGSVVLPE
jgi:predicted lactoylglutathione lyase